MARYKVLIPMDGSPLSRQILPKVMDLLDPQKYELILLRVAPIPHLASEAPPPLVSPSWPYTWYIAAHTVERETYPLTSSQLQESQRSALTDELLRHKYMLAEHGYEVSTLVRFGEPANEIVDCATTVEVDLVAMATHGRTGLSHLLLGSVAERVLHRLTIPVLLFRPERAAVESEIFESAEVAQ